MSDLLVRKPLHQILQRFPLPGGEVIVSGHLSGIEGCSADPLKNDGQCRMIWCLVWGRAEAIDSGQITPSAWKELWRKLTIVPVGEKHGSDLAKKKTVQGSYRLRRCRVCQDLCRLRVNVKEREIGRQQQDSRAWFRHADHQPDALPCSTNLCVPVESDKGLGGHLQDTKCEFWSSVIILL